jgi:sortase A
LKLEPQNWSTVPARAGAVLRRSLSSTVASSHRRALRGWSDTVSVIGATDTHSNPALRAAVPRPSDRALLRLSGATLTLVGLLLLGFVLQVVGISGLSELRSQSNLYQQLRTELASATAPVAQVDGANHLYPLGTPMFTLTVPSIGLRQVVVEGTSSRTMLEGPGHRRDTPLPGQAGATVIMGRQSAYGAPFGSIGSLKPGDMITAITGQGVSHYRVSGVRFAGDPQPAALAAGKGRLTLVSATGLPYLPFGVIRVDATLVGKPFVTPNPVLLVGSLTDAELPLASDPSGWLPLTFLLEGAVLALVLFSLAFRRWGRWQTWVVALPVSLLLGAGIGEQVMVLLPNLY